MLKISFKKINKIKAEELEKSVFQIMWLFYNQIRKKKLYNFFLFHLNDFFSSFFLFIFLYFNLETI